MQTTTLRTTLLNELIGCETFVDIFNMLKSSSSFDEKLRNSLNTSSLKLIKFSNELLYIMFDRNNKSRGLARLRFLKEVSQKIIQNCIAPLVAQVEEENKTTLTMSIRISSKKEVLAKWWGNYLTLLEEFYREKCGEKGWPLDRRLWVNEEELALLERSMDALEDESHWSIYLAKECCGGRVILTSYYDEDQRAKFSLHCLSVMRSLIVQELDFLRLKKDQIGMLVEGTLASLLALLDKAIKKPLGILACEILLGRIQKKPGRGLDHSVIFADSGAFYALLNSVSPEEKAVLEKVGEVSAEYSQAWKFKEGKFKIVIGKGSFGKLRLVLALTRNPLVRSMKPGQILCVKKSVSVAEMANQDIRLNSWNDYTSSQVAKFLYSPIIHDLKIVENTERIHEKHRKGYCIQEFRPLFNGEQAFKRRLESSFYDDWSHQKPFLQDIFDHVHKLLVQGICMTDLKLANTLYDPINRRGMLIDLSGVVIRPSMQKLSSCKLKYMTEMTPSYTDPEVLKLIEKKDGEVKVDLCQCAAYSLGVICERTGVKNAELVDLIDKLKCPKDRRIGIEEAIETLSLMVNAENDYSKLSERLPALIQSIREKTLLRPSNFGLSFNILKTISHLIDLKCAEINPERHDGLELFDLDQELDSFLSIDGQAEEEVQVFLLLGSCGSGKSTMMQRKYLEALKNWEPGKAVPIFMNLASEEDLKARWEWLMEAVAETEVKFSLFSGAARYPVVLFLDSFDEVPAKINFISRFFHELGRNPFNRFIVSCRSELIQNEELDLERWFSVSDCSVTEMKLVKRYIAPLNVVNFDIDNYLKKNCEANQYHHLREALQAQNLRSLLKTSYMVQITIEILPELTSLDQGGSISRSEIYEKYNRKKLEKEEKRMEKINFYDFAEESAILLSVMLFAKASSRLVLQGSAHPFLRRHNYDANITSLENLLFFSVVRGLDLHIETRDHVPNERIILGFCHDSMKSFYLVKAIKRQLLEKIPEEGWILGQRSIVDDEVLICFLTEEVRQNKAFEYALRNEVFKSREADRGTESIAAANAITVLVASNIWFHDEDFSGIRIAGANIRDGHFVDCDFTDADLTAVIMENCKLEASIFKRTLMKELKLGVYPDIMVGSPVWSCCFSKDGQFIVSGSDDHMVKLWDTATGKPFPEFERVHAGPVRSVAISAHNFHIVSGSDDKTLILWDRKTGKALKSMLGHDNIINSVVFSPNRLMILSGSSDKTAKLWDRSTGSLLKSFEEHTNAVLSVAFSPDGVDFLTGSADKTIKLWVPSSGVSKRTFSGHTECVNCVAYSPNSRLFLSGSDDNTVKVWDKFKGQLLNTLIGHSVSVNSVAFSNDGLTILSGSEDKTVKLWDKSTGKLLKNFEGHKSSVKSIAFSPNGLSLLSGSYDKTIKLWDKSTSKLLKNFSGHTNIVKTVAFSPDGGFLLSGSTDKTVKLWDKSNGDLVKSLEGHSEAVRCVCFDPNGKFVVSGSEDKTARLWSTKNGKPVVVYQGHKNAVNAVDCSKQGGLVVTGSDDKTVRVWMKETGEMLKSLEGHTFNVNCVIFSPDSSQILSGSSDQNLKLWDVSTLGLLMEFKAHNFFVNCVAFSPDGTYLLSGSDDKTIKLWQKSSDNVLHAHTFEGHTKQVRSVAFAPDCLTFVSGSSDFTVRLWDIKARTLLKTLEVHLNVVTSVAFSPDGECILTGSADQTVKLLKKSEEKLSRKIYKHKENVNFSLHKSQTPLKKPKNSNKSSDLKRQCSDTNNGLQSELNLFFTFEYEFRCVKTIKNSETGLVCKDMILENVQELSSSNKSVLMQRGALELKNK